MEFGLALDERTFERTPCRTGGELRTMHLLCDGKRRVAHRDRLTAN